MGKTAGLNFDVFLDDHGMKRSMQELKSTATMLKSEMRANFAELKSGGQITDAYAGKVKDSERAIKAQNNIIADAKKAQKGLNLQTEEGRKEFSKQEKIITSAKNSITSLAGEQKRAKSSLDFYKSGMAEMNRTMKVASSASEAYVSRLRAEGKENKANQEQLTGLRNKYNSLSDVYKKQEAELNKIASSSNKTSEAYLKQKTRLDQTGKAMAKAKTDMNGLNETIAKANPSVFDRVKSKLSGVTKEAEKSNHLFGKMTIASTIGNSVSTAFSNLASNLKESVKAGYEIDEAGEKIGKQWKGLGLSNSQVQKMLGQIGDIRNKSNMAGTAVDSLQKRFYALTGSAKDARALTETVTAFGKASGLADEKIAGMAPMMSRLIGSTKVTSSLFTRVMGRAPELQKAIISASGMSQKAFTNALQNGKITGQQLEGYMVKASKNSGKAWAEFGSTSEGMLAKVQGVWKSANASFAKPLAENAFNGISKAMATLYDKNGKLNETGQSVQNIAKALGTKVGDGIEFAMDWMVKNRKPLGEIATSVFNIAKDIGSGIWAVFSGIIKDLGGHFGKASDGAKPLADSINSISKHPKIFETMGKALAVYFVASKLTGFIGALTTITRLSKRLIIKPQVDTLTGERQLTAFGTWAQKQMSGIGLNNSIGIGNKWKSMNKVGKVATVAVGAKVVWDASADLAKGLKSKNPDKKLTAYASGTGKVIGGAIGTAMGGPLGGIIGEDIGGKFADKFATGWEKYQKKHPLKVSQVKGYTNQVNYEGYKGLSGDADVNQRKKEGLVASALDPRMWVNADAYLVGDVGHAAKEGAKGASKAWSWLTTTQNPGKGNKPITMPKIKFPKIKLPNIWKWLTTDVKPKTKPIEAPKFKKIKWPSLPKWMNWKTWKWPKFKAPKMPKIKWPKVPNLAKSWSSATKKLSKNFNSWKKSFSKSWSKHWKSTKNTLSSSWTSMLKTSKRWGSNVGSWFGKFKKSFSKSWSKHWKSTKGTLSYNWASMLKTSKRWGNNTDSWFGKFKKSFSKAWQKHWKSVKGYLGDRWDDMRSKAGSWGTSMEKWRKSFSSTFKKGFSSLGSGIHDIWSNMWSGLHKLAHSGMKGVVDIINDGINGIDGVIHLFGGKKHAIKPIHFATGTGSLSSNFRKSIDRVTPAIVNDEPGATNPELIYRKASNSIEYSTKKNAHTVLMPGDEVANARDSATFGAPHFAKGGIGSFFGGIGSAISNTVSGAVSKISQTTNWLKKLFTTATKIIAHPVKSVEDLFKYSKGTTKGVFQQISKGTFGKVESSAKGWWSKLWSMVNLNGDGASGDTTGLLSAVEKYGKGHKYVWGADGPNSFDCSGLVMYALKKAFGISYPHFSGSQYSKTKHISKSEAQAGDLVFWGPGKHVGVYAGGDKYYSAFSPSAHPNIGMYSLAGSVPGYSPLFGAVKGLSHSKGKSSKTSTKGIKGQVGSGFWKMISKLADKFGVNNGTNAAGDSEAPSGSHKHWMEQAGIPKSWYNAANTIISAESGWNAHAQNPSSSAYGIPQALPGSKMASAGKDWKNNAITQLKWFKSYVKGRYGNANNALKFRESHNWYANGGFSSTAKLANISEGNLMESVIPLSKPSRAWELIGKSAAYLTKKNNSHTASANTSEDNSEYLQQLIDQNSQLLNQIGQFMQLVQAKPTGITAQQVYAANKQQATIQTNRYNRSLGLS